MQASAEDLRGQYIDPALSALMPRRLITLAPTIDADPAGAQSILDAATAVGVDLDDVAAVLEEEGVASFVKSFDELLVSLEAKADTLR